MTAIQEGRCATCKHWDREEMDSSALQLNLGACRAVPMYWDSTDWPKEGDHLVWKSKFEKTTAFAQDGSDYRAWLYTKAAHGCTMYEAAP